MILYNAVFGLLLAREMIMAGIDVTWVWDGDCKLITSHAKNKDGCCVIGYKGKTWKIHRLVWTIHNGPIPEGIHILQSCNKPACISLDHLTIGINKTR